MKNLSESDLFVDAASLFLKTKSAKDLFKPVNEKGLKKGMILVDTCRGWDKANGMYISEAVACNIDSIGGDDIP